MKIPIDWLKDYLEIDMDINEYARRMTMSGSKVENIEVQAENITGVVVGRINSVEPHPDADKLVICEVDIGSDVLRIVTGASNIFSGALVPVAVHGAVLAEGLKIKKGKIRGVESFGMMCSVEELGYSSGDFPDAPEDGIYIFREDIPLGTDVRDALGINKVVVEFEITPNRPDCLSVYGIVLETAATFDIPKKRIDPVLKENGEGTAEDYISVNVLAEDLCERYIAKVVTDVCVAPSPKWMRERLLAAGVRSINNIVDITNYVMLELGQPLHAFDAKHLKGNTINVRRALDKEKIVTLDEKERILDSEMQVIADAEKPVCIAGVMGGRNSGITEDTTRVILESAMFSSPSIRRTSKKLGLRSDSSARFEKGLDAAGSLKAINRACELVELLDCGKVVPGKVDIYPAPRENALVPFSAKKINAFLGTDITATDMVSFLKRLDFIPNAASPEEVTAFAVPSYRKDVTVIGDLAEEIARLYDYNNIVPTLSAGEQTTIGGKTAEQKAEDRITGILNSCGLSEIYTYSFYSPKVFGKIRLPEEHPLRNAVTISNPLGEDFSIMRTTAIPSMLDILSKNYSKRNADAELFERGKVYLPIDGEDLPEERKIVILGAYGEHLDFYHFKGYIELLVSGLGIDAAEFLQEENNPAFHPGRTAKLLIDMQPAGVFGQIHPETAAEFGLPEKTFIAEIFQSTLVKSADSVVKYKELPKYPAVTRDLAIIVDENIPISEFDKAIKKFGGKLLESSKLFDIYKGKQVPEGKKSVAYALIFRTSTGTLTDSEVQKVMDKIENGLNSQLGAELRI